MGKKGLPLRPTAKRKPDEGQTYASESATVFPWGPSSATDLDVPPVRVIVYLTEPVIEGCEIHIMCKHINGFHWKRHNGEAMGWNSCLHPAGAQEITQGHLFFVDVPRPHDDVMVFKFCLVYTSSNKHYLEKADHLKSPLLNPHGNRIHKIKSSDSIIFATVMENMRKWIWSPEPKETAAIRTLCGLLGKHETQCQVWDPEVWPDFCQKVLTAFDTTLSIWRAGEMGSMVWDALQRQATTDPGGALLRILQFVSPVKLAELLKDERAQILLGFGQCLVPAWQNLLNVDASMLRHATYINHVPVHLFQLQFLYQLHAWKDDRGDDVTAMVCAFLLRNFVSSQNLALDKLAEFFEQAGMKALVEKHFDYLLSVLLTIPDATFPCLIPFLVTACRSFSQLCPVAKAVCTPSSDPKLKRILQESIMNRIRLSCNWFAVPLLDPHDVRPVVDDIVRLRNGVEKKIVSDWGGRWPFRVCRLNDKSGESRAVTLEEIKVITKKRISNVNAQGPAAKLGELQHLVKLLTDYNLLEFKMLEAILTSSCWEFDSVDANRPLLRTPFLDSCLAMRQKVGISETDVSAGMAHARCLQLLRKRAEVIASSEMAFERCMSDLIDSAVLIQRTIMSDASACASDWEGSLLHFGSAIFTDLLPDDVFGKYLSALMIPLVKDMHPPLLSVLKQRALNIAFKGGDASRISQLRAFFTPLERPEVIDVQAANLLVDLADNVLTNVLDMEAAVSSTGSVSQYASHIAINLLSHPELWRYVFDVYEQVNWPDIPQLPGDNLTDRLLDKISHMRAVLVEERDRICKGTLLIDTLVLFEQWRDRFRVLAPSDTALSESLSKWFKECHEIENSERIIVDFLKLCVPQSKLLRRPCQSLGEAIETFTSQRRRAQHVSTWKTFPLVRECHAEMNFLLQAQKSRSAQHLWRELGHDAAEEFQVPGPGGEAELIKAVYKRFSKELKGLLTTIDRGDQANSTLKPFITSLQKDIKAPEPPPKGLGQKQARAFIEQTQQKFRAEVQNRAEEDINHLLKLFQTSGIELLGTPQVLVERFKNIYKMWQTRSKVGALHRLLTPASSGEKSVKEYLPDCLYRDKQYHLLSEIVHDLDKFDHNAIDISLKRFEEFTTQCPEIQDTLELTLSSLSTAVRKGLLTELREFADPAEFITFQERWLADFSEGVEEDVCVSFGRVREALQNVVYGDRRERSPRTVADFLLELNSLSIADLNLLSERVKLVTKQRLRGIELAGLTALERSVRLLKHGVFEVSLLKNRAVQFAGRLPQGKDVDGEFIPQEDLFDLRNQVVMAEIPTDAVEVDESVQSQSRDADMKWKGSQQAEDATLTMLSRPDQRIFVIQEFSWLLDKLREMAQKISQLRDDGHVQFQSGGIKVAPNKESVEQQLKWLHKVRTDWLQLVNNVRYVQPLLSLLFPKELVQLFLLVSEMHQKQFQNTATVDPVQEESRQKQAPTPKKKRRKKKIERASQMIVDVDGHVARLRGILSVIAPVSVQDVKSVLENAQVFGTASSSGSHTTRLSAKDVLDVVKRIMSQLISRDAIFDRCILAADQPLVKPQLIKELQSTLGRLQNKAVPFSMVTASLHPTRCPELILLAYYAHLKRLPTPFEVLLCNKQTSLPDIIAFLRRWSESAHLEPYLNTAKAAGAANKPRPLLFCLGNAQDLPSTVQIEMQKELVQVRESLQDSGQPCMPLVMMVLAADSEQVAAATTATLAGLRAEREPIGPVIGPAPQQDRAAWQLLMLHLRDFVTIVESEHPCAGKTRHIRTQIANKKLLYVSLLAGDDIISLSSRLSDIFIERRCYAPDRNLGLHIEVAHNASYGVLNEFLFHLFVHRSWSDPDGVLYNLEAGDHLFVEMPSQGRPGDHHVLEQLPLCRALPSITPPSDISIQTPKVVSLRVSGMPDGHRTLLHEVTMSKDCVMEQALQWLHTLNTTKATRIWPAPSNTHKPVRDGRARDVIAEAMEDAARNWSAETPASGKQQKTQLRLFQLQRVLKYVGPQFQKISSMVSNLLAAETPGSEMFTFYLMYQWLLVQLVVRSARSVSVSAVGPPTQSSAQDAAMDHVTRFQSMDTFYKSEHAFVIMDDNGAFSMVSLSEQSVLRELLQNYPSSVPNLQLFQSLLTQIFHFDTATMQPLSDLREKLVDLRASRKKFWELFNIRKPLLLLNAMDEYKKAQGTQNEKSKLLAAHEQLRDLGNLHPAAPRVEPYPNRLTFWNDAQQMLDFYWQPDYTITVDNLVRLLHVQLRLSVGIPVFFLGETGCGKTSAVHFLARMLGCPFHVVNVHGGMRGRDLWEALQPAIKEAENAECDSWVYVLLDESNSMPDTGVVHDISCNQMCEGFVLPENVRIMSLMNPTRFKPKVSDSIEGGMDCNEYYESLNAGSCSILETHISDRRNPFSNTVYPVYEMPESILTLVWDWGDAAEHHMKAADAKKAVGNRTIFIDPLTNGETIHIEALVHNMVSSGFNDGGQNVPALMNQPVAREIQKLQADSFYWRAMRSIITAAIAHAQHFIRFEIHAGDGSAVSLRDIKRCVKLLLWILSLYDIRRQAEKDGLPRMSGESHQQMGKLPRCAEVRSALLVAITQCYALRLNKRKDDLKQAVMQSWQKVRDEFQNLPLDFMPVPKADDFYLPYHDITRFVCDQVRLEPGVARNEAMRENIFSLFLSICTRTATFLVGKPGSSKSSSMDAVAGSMQNREHPFWGKFPRIHKKTFQCGPLDTPQSIQEAAYQVARLQIKQGGMSGQEAVGVLVLEEIGVTALSPHNPLMSLHSLIDHGVLVDGHWVPICMIGISNWRVDPAKVNRAFMIFRGDPSPEDIMLTGQQIILGSTGGNGGQDHREQLQEDQDDVFNASQAQQLGSVLGAVAGVIWESIIRDPTYNHFYGLRDYYGLVKFLHRELTYPLELELEEDERTSSHNITSQSLQHHLVRWAIAQNLSCLPYDAKQPDAQAALEDGLEKALARSERDRQQPATWQLTSSREALCSTCARGALRLLRRQGDVSGKLERLPGRTNRICNCVHPPVLQRIAWNLEHRDSRYLMLITRDSQALYLLFSSGLARSQGTLVVTGSDLADDNGDAWILKTLQKIQTAMRLGLFLVLVKCRRLYENLLDMTNQHFLVEGGRKYTRLSMQAHSRYFYVHDHFSLAILVEEDEVQTLPPPWLNRFEKATFTYSSVLGEEHRQLQGQLEVLTGVGSVARSFNLCHKLLPGFTSDTLASLVFEVVGTPNGDIDAKERAMQYLQMALFRLAAAASSRTMMELYCCYEGSNIPGFEEFRLECTRSTTLQDMVKQLLFAYFQVQPHDSLHEVLTRGRQVLFGDGGDSFKEASEEDDLLEKKCPWGDQHGLTLAVMTEELIPAGTEERMLKAKFSSENVVVQTLNMDIISSDHDVESHLNGLFGELASHVKEAFLFITCSVSVTVGTSIRNLLFQCSERRSKFIEMQRNTEVVIPRHLVLICKVGNQRQKMGQVASSFKLYFDSRWHWVFVDAIFIPRNGSRHVSLKEYITKPLFESGEDTTEEPAESPESPILSVVPGHGALSIQDILKDRMLDVVKNLLYPVADPRGRYGSLLARADGFRKMIDTRAPGIDVLLDRVYRELQHAPQFREDVWFVHPLEKYDQALSVKDNFESYITNAVVVIFKELVGLLDTHGNLRFAADLATSNMWAELFKAPFVSGSVGNAMFTKNVGMHPEALLVRVGGLDAMETGDGIHDDRVAADGRTGERLPDMIDELFFPAEMNCTFPFSCAIARRIFSQRDHQDHLTEILSSQCSTLLLLKKDHLRNFCGDVLVGAFSGQLDAHAKEALLILSEVLGAGDSICRFFQQLWTHDRLFVQMQRLVGQGAQPGGWATDKFWAGLKQKLSDVNCKLLTESMPVDAHSSSDHIDEPMHKKMRYADDWVVVDDANEEDTRPAKVRKLEQSQPRTPETTVDMNAHADLPKQTFLVQVLEQAIRQLFSDVRNVDKQGLSEIQHTTMNPVQQLMEFLRPHYYQSALHSKSTNDPASSASNAEETTDQCIMNLWETWNYCFTLKKLTLSTPEARVARSCIDDHIKILAKDPKHFPANEVLPRVTTFIKLIEQVTRSEGCLVGDKLAMASCVVPIFRLLLPLEPNDAECNILVPMLVGLVLGHYKLDGDRLSHHVLTPIWLDSDGDVRSAPGAPVTYSTASAFISWILRWYHSGSHHCAAFINKLISDAIQESPLRENSHFGLIIGQVWLDHLGSLAAAHPVHSAIGALQTLLPLGEGDVVSETCTSAFTRILVVTTLKFLLQSYADVMVQMASVQGDDEAIIAELEERRAPFRPVIATLFDFASSTSVPEIATAIQALSSGNGRRYFMIFFLRSLSRNGLDCDHARSILNHDAGRSAGSFRNLFLPSVFHQHKVVLDFCQPPPRDSEACAFVLHEGFSSAWHALSIVLDGKPGDCDRQAEALLILNGENLRWPMPEDAGARTVAFVLAVVHHSLEASDRIVAQTLMKFIKQVPCLPKQNNQLQSFLRILLNPTDIQNVASTLLLDSANRRIAEAMLHFLVLLLGFRSNHNGPLEFFHRILTDGLASTEKLFVPAVMDSPYLGILRGGVPPNYHVYQGGCGHMFVTGECEHITSAGICPECGKRVGQGRAGTQRLGNVSEVLQQWGAVYSKRFPTCTGFRLDGRGANHTERQLPPVSYRILRFCIEAAAVGKALLGKQAECGRLITLENLVNELQVEISSLKDHLFPDHGDEASTFLYVHSAIAQFVAASHQDAKSSWPLTDEASRQSYETFVVRAMQPLVGRHTDEVRQLRGKMDSAQEAHLKNETVEEVKFTPWFFKQAQESSDNACLWSPTSAHWIPQTALSLQMFWAQLDANPGLPVLKLLREYTTFQRDSEPVVVPGSKALSDLHLLQHMPSVANFLRLLLIQFANRLTRTEASALLLGEAIDEVKSTNADAGRKLEAAAEEFEEAFQAVWPQVHIHMGRNGCIDFNSASTQHLRLLHRKSILQVPLECFLPSQEGDGVMAMAIFARLSGVQRQFLTRLKQAISLQNLCSLELRPLTCSSRDIVQISPSNHLAPRLAEHVVRTLGHASDRLTFDALESLEDEVLSTLELCRKPFLAWEPPEMRYTDEFGQLGVLATLHTGQGGRGRIQQEMILPPAAEAAIRRVLHLEPVGRDQLLRYFLLLASLAIQGGVHADQLLSDFTSSHEIQLLLDVAQQRIGSNLYQVSQLRSALRLSHLRCLAAILWDGKVHESFDREPNAAQKSSIETVCQKLRSAQQSSARFVLAALRRYGYEQFSYFRFPETVERPRGSGNQVPNPVWDGNNLGLYLDVDIPEGMTYPPEMQDLSIRIFGTVLRELESLDKSEKDVPQATVEDASFADVAAYRDIGIAQNENFDSAITDITTASKMASLDNDLTRQEQVDKREKTQSVDCPEPAQGMETSLMWQSSSVSLDLSDDFDLEAIVRDQLQDSLSIHGRTLDTSIPMDGHCLFHALRAGGLLGELQHEITIPEMRKVALQQASREQLEIVAEERGITVEQYEQRMQRNDWGDNLMIALLAAVFNHAITVVTPATARTFYPQGTECDGVDEQAVWVAYNNTTHYYGVSFAS